MLMNGPTHPSTPAKAVLYILVYILVLKTKNLSESTNKSSHQTKRILGQLEDIIKLHIFQPH